MNRFIIGGASPNIKNIPHEVYDTGTVIGCNDWMLHSRCDIYISLDFGTCWRKWKREIVAMAKRGVPIYARGNPNRRPFATPGVQVHWFMRHTPRLPEKICAKTPLRKDFGAGYLFWWGTTPTAGIHLAYTMGATEVVLAGFDCYGNKRWNGYTYTAKDLNFKPAQIAKGLHRQGWTSTAPWINRGLKMLNRHIPIYKTLKVSPLECLYLDPTSPYALDPDNASPPTAESKST